MCLIIVSSPGIGDHARAISLYIPGTNQGIGGDIDPFAMPQEVSMPSFSVIRITCFSDFRIGFIIEISVREQIKSAWGFSANSTRIPKLVAARTHNA